MGWYVSSTGGMTCSAMFVAMFVERLCHIVHCVTFITVQDIFASDEQTNHAVYFDGVSKSETIADRIVSLVQRLPSASRWLFPDTVEEVSVVSVAIQYVIFVSLSQDDHISTRCVFGYGWEEGKKSQEY